MTGKVEMIEIVRIVNSVFESNTYLAISRNCDLCFLIDCGDPAPIIENINNRGLHLKGIFITHSHFDHIYGLDSIIDEYPETPIIPHMQQLLYHEIVCMANGCCFEKRIGLYPYSQEGHR